MDKVRITTLKQLFHLIERIVTKKLYVKLTINFKDGFIVHTEKTESL